MLIRVHRATRLVVAVCDSEIVGKIFEEENRQLNLGTSFFKGEEKNEQEIFELLKFYKKEDACFNIVGEKSCNIALKIGIINQKQIDKIEKVPFAIILL